MSMSQLWRARALKEREKWSDDDEAQSHLWIHDQMYSHVTWLGDPPAPNEYGENIGDSVCGSHALIQAFRAIQKDKRMFIMVEPFQKELITCAVCNSYLNGDYLISVMDV